MTFGQQMMILGFSLTLLGSILTFWGNLQMQAEAKQSLAHGKKLERMNLIPFFERNYNALFYSFNTLKNLPGFSKEDIVRPINKDYEKRAFQIKRFKLNNPNKYYLNYPDVNHVKWSNVFFIFPEENEFDKANLHKIFESKESLELGLKLNENLEVAKTHFGAFWNSLPESRMTDTGPVDSIVPQNEISQDDLRRVEHLQARAKNLYKRMEEIHGILLRLNDAYGYSFHIFE